MRPSVVVVGSCNAVVCDFSTCRGNPAQPDANRIAAANSSLNTWYRRATAPRDLLKEDRVAWARQQDLGIGP
jgi:hypothetical protein